VLIFLMASFLQFTSEGKKNSHRMELLQDLVLGCTKVTVEGTHNWYHKLLLSLWSLVLSDLNLGNLYSFHA
jgi:hypothetical protein